MASFKIIVIGIVCLVLSAFLFFEYERLFGAMTTQPITTPYMQWFFMGAVVVSVLIVLVGWKRPAR